jgi:hypothetical protein
MMQRQSCLAEGLRASQERSVPQSASPANHHYQFLTHALGEEPPVRTEQKADSAPLVVFDVLENVVHAAA